MDTGRPVAVRSKPGWAKIPKGFFDVKVNKMCVCDVYVAWMTMFELQLIVFHEFTNIGRLDL